MNRRGLIGAGLAAALLPHSARAASLAQMEESAFRLKRLGIASATTLAAVGLDAPAAQSLEIAGVAPAIRDGFFRLFFAGSQVVIGNAASAEPVVGYYSPTLDCWWITKWRGSAAIADAWFFPAPLFAGEGGLRRPPAWTEGLPERTFLEWLIAGTRGAVREFRSEFARDSAAAPQALARLAGGNSGAVAVRRRVAAIASGISRFSADANAYAAYMRLCAALSSEGEPASPAGLAADARGGFGRVAAAPRALRANLTLIAAIRGTDGWFLVSAASDARRALIVSAVTGAGAQPIARVALVNPSESEGQP